MYSTFAVSHRTANFEKIFGPIAIGAVCAVFFSIGMYGGYHFAWAASASSVSVSSSVSANGTNGSAGADGANGSNGSDGSTGTSSVSVHVKTVVNGKVTEDIDQRKESADGSGISVNVSNGTVTWATSSDGSAVNVSIDSDSDGAAQPIETGNRTVSNISAVRAHEATDTVASETASAAPSGPDRSSNTSNISSVAGGFYSLCKEFFNHVASFFHF